MTMNHQLWYRRLPDYVYSSILFPTTLYRRGNRDAQIFATDFGWSHLFPIKMKSDAHEALSLFFWWNGVKLAIFCDNAKNDPSRVQQETKGVIMSFETIRAIHPMVNARKR